VSSARVAAAESRRRASAGAIECGRFVFIRESL
jgi:hypothetical protein